MAKDNEPEVSQQMEQGIAQMDQLKNQIESLSMQRESLSSVILDYDRSVQVLTAMVSSSSDIFLLPLGGQVFVNARMTDMEKCIVDQGSGVLMERNIEEAIEQVKERKEKVKGAVASIDRSIQELMSRYQEVTQRTQKIYDQQMRSGPGPEKTF